jgi:branched-chain amino acid transport system substrate-binding protein
MAAVAATAILTLAACGNSGGGGSGGGDGGSAGGDILIGYTGDLSGVFAISGSGALKGIQAYIDQVNRGGGIDGRKLKLDALDDAGDPTRALANVQQLLTQDKVQAMLGSTISGLCEAVQDTLEKAQMPIVCTAAGPTQVSPPAPSTWIYEAQTSQDHMVAPVVDLIRKLEGLADKPKVAYIYYDSASHIGFANAFTPALKQLGWPQTDVEKVPLVANPPVRDLATKIANSHPDVVVSFMVDSTAKLFYETLRSQGFTGPIIQNPDTGVTILNDVKDPDLYVLTHEYVTNTASDKIGGDATYNAMVAALKADNTNPDVSYVPRGYLNAMTLVTALKACNVCTGSDLADAILHETVPSNGITPGDLKFSADNHSGSQEMPAYDYRNGAITLYADHLKIGMTPN